MFYSALFVKMPYKKRIERLEERIDYLEKDISNVKITFKMIFDYLNIEIKTTPVKTELVANEMQDKKVCTPEEHIEERKLDKRENCLVCPKCNKHPMGIMWDEDEDCLIKDCECGYSWKEDCEDKSK